MMASDLPFDLRPVTTGGPTPAWTGNGFRTGDRLEPILSYEVGESGWTDELTTIHEDAAGTDHYMDRASREHTLKQLRSWVKSGSLVLIDVGCSSGLMLEPIAQQFPGATVVGADYVSGPLQALAKRSPKTPFIQFDLTRCPLPDASFDGIVLLNVLEHIEDDSAAIGHVARILKPDGVAVIEVPAGPHLYDVYDKVFCHERRYKIGDIISKLERHGLEVVHRSHMGWFLYPAFWAAKMRGKRYLNAPKEVQQKIVAGNLSSGRAHPLMHFVMRVESALREFVYFPVGIRCLITCRRIR